MLIETTGWLRVILPGGTRDTGSSKQGPIFQNNASRGFQLSTGTDLSLSGKYTLMLEFNSNSRKYRAGRGSPSLRSGFQQEAADLD
jgi:hypothetical protein